MTTYQDKAITDRHIHALIEKIKARKIKTEDLDPSFVIDGDNISDGSITTDKIADDAVTTNKIADAAVTEDKLDDAAVTADKIASGSITSGKYANSEVAEQEFEVESTVTIPARFAKWLNDIDGLHVSRRAYHGNILRLFDNYAYINPSNHIHDSYRWGYPSATGMYKTRDGFTEVEEWQEARRWARRRCGFYIGTTDPASITSQYVRNCICFQLATSPSDGAGDGYGW